MPAKSKGVVRNLNDSRLKKISLEKLTKALGAHKGLLIGGTAGLSLWLFANALSSKKNNQGDY